MQFTNATATTEANDDRLNEVLETIRRSKNPQPANDTPENPDNATGQDKPFEDIYTARIREQIKNAPDPLLVMTDVVAVKRVTAAGVTAFHAGDLTLSPGVAMPEVRDRELIIVSDNTSMAGGFLAGLCDGSGSGRRRIIRLPGMRWGHMVRDWLQVNTVQDLQRIVNVLAKLPCYIEVHQAGNKNLVQVAIKTAGRTFARDVNPASSTSRRQFEKDLSADMPDLAEHAKAILDAAGECAEAACRMPRTSGTSKKDRAKFSYGDDDDNCIIWNSPDGPVRLSNFKAQILADVVMSDGIEGQERRYYDIQIESDTRRIPTSEYDSMNWVSQFGGRYSPCGEVPRGRQLLAEAIKELSPYMQKVTQHSHTGWVVDERGRRCFLTASGAMTADGLDTSVKTTTAATDHIGYYQLVNPPSGPELAECVRKSFDLLKLTANRGQTWPLMACIHLAPVMSVNYITYPFGETGSRKTAVARTFMAHLGIDWRRQESIPSLKNATIRSLEDKMFFAADVPLLIDDYRRPSTRSGTDRSNNVADQVFQNAADHAARLKLNRDGTQSATKPPRCVVLSTGEDMVPGHSTTARMLPIPFQKLDVNLDVLTACQEDADAGVYNRAYSGYVRWVIARYDVLVKQAAEMRLKLRSEFQMPGDHGRIGENLATAMVGCWLFLSYARDVGAIDNAECNQLHADAMTSLKGLIDVHREEIAGTTPAEQFIEALKQILMSGRGHITTRDSAQPPWAGRLGWKRVNEPGTMHVDADAAVWVANTNSPRIGVIDNDGCIGVWLKTALEVINRHSHDGERLTISHRELGRQMLAAGMLITDPGRTTKTVKIDGGPDRVTLIRASVMGTALKIAPADDAQAAA